MGLYSNIILLYTWCFYSWDLNKAFAVSSFSIIELNPLLSSHDDNNLLRSLKTQHHCHQVFIWSPYFPCLTINKNLTFFFEHLFNLYMNMCIGYWLRLFSESIHEVGEACRSDMTLLVLKMAWNEIQRLWYSDQRI